MYRLSLVCERKKKRKKKRNNRHICESFVCFPLFVWKYVRANGSERESERGKKRNVLVYTEYMLFSGESPHSTPDMSTFTASKRKKYGFKPNKAPPS